MVTESNVVKYEERGHVAVVTLDRAEQRNAFDRELSAATLAAWDRIKADPNIRVAIVTGAGPAFSAGADLKKLIPHIRAASDEDNRAGPGKGRGGRESRVATRSTPRSSPPSTATASPGGTSWRSSAISE